jgi:hypothetical protein
MNVKLAPAPASDIGLLTLAKNDKSLRLELPENKELLFERGDVILLRVMVHKKLGVKLTGKSCKGHFPNCANSTAVNKDEHARGKYLSPFFFADLAPLRFNQNSIYGNGLPDIQSTAEYHQTWMF